MNISLWFIAVFALLWLLVPVTQLIFLVAPRIHHKLGMTEDKALEPQFRWFLLDEIAIAFADMTYLLSGAAFLWLALSGSQTALIFGLYSCACYVYIPFMAISRWRLLAKHDLSPISKGQLPIYVGYMLLMLLFGLFGLVYLWGLVPY